MILVAVGASHIPFDRLMRALDGADFAERLVVQHGPSAVRPPNARLLEFVPAQELAALVREASAVVTHAGVGSILLALTNGKRPFVVPRLGAFGETVDDHQLESARRFAAAGLVTLVEDPADLPAATAAPHETLSLERGEPRLVAELRSYVTEVVG
jgi:UDP-N-acetylglucosamine--N-acetylmuramyl-(pentapeptide) pyrophosphoryl-undecaprenol N-acetylglucosamine transferase